MTLDPSRALQSFAVGAMLTVSISVGAMAQSAAGQIGADIDCALASSFNLSPADIRRIDTFTSTLAPDLTSDDPTARAQARNRLLRPLGCATVSVAFRMQYGASLIVPLKQMVGPNADPQVQANALRILGRVRATQSLSALSTGLSDPRPAVRFAATVGYQELLSKPAQEQWPIRQRSLDGVLDELGKILVDDSDPFVVNGAVVALSAIDPADAALREQAVRRIAQGLSDRRAKLILDPNSEAEFDQWIRCYHRALIAVRNTLLQQNGQSGQQNFGLAAAIFGGQGLVLARQLMTLQPVQENPQLESLVADIVSTAEGVVVFGAGSVGQTTSTPGLRKFFNQHDTNAFDSALAPWIGSAGLLTRSPFSVPAEHFK